MILARSDLVVHLNPHNPIPRVSSQSPLQYTIKRAAFVDFSLHLIPVVLIGVSFGEGLA